MAACLCILTICACKTMPVAYAEENNEVNTQQVPDSSFIYDMNIIDVSNADPYYDKQVVQVVGEVVGDSLSTNTSDEYRWITLLSENTNSNASITIYMPKNEVEKIDVYGKYEASGTILRVKGVYHLVCEEHEGLSDIHADQVSLVSKGEKTPHNFDLKAFLPGALTIFIGLALTLVYTRLREKNR